MKHKETEHLLSTKANKKRLLEEPKQETLEEAASKYYNNFEKRKEEFAFIDGAKWQEQKMYSEEDMKEFGQWMTSGVEFMDDTEKGRVYYFKKKLYTTKELLEIFKKENK